MTETNPLFLNIDNVYGSDELTLPYRDLIGEGVVEADDLAVTQNGTPNMSVNVAEGAVWVQGDHDVARQPTYRAYNDATVNLAIAAADATNPRLDLIIAEVLDDLFSGTSKLWQLRVVEGTPDPAPVEPSLPLSAHKLAVVTVGAGVSSILDADIEDTRARAKVGAGAAQGQGLTFATGEFAVPGATGPLVISGLGFRPKRIMFTGNRGNVGSRAEGFIGWALDTTGATQFASTWAASSTAFTTQNAALSCIRMDAAGGGVLYRAQLTVLSDDGFTVNFDVVSGGTVRWTAEG